MKRLHLSRLFTFPDALLAHLSLSRYREAAAHLGQQLKHISAALAEVEKTDYQLQSTRATLSRTQENVVSLENALSRKEHERGSVQAILARTQEEVGALSAALSRKELEYAAAYSTCEELRANLDATERAHAHRLHAEQAIGAARAADLESVLAKREALVSDLASANRSLEAQLGDAQLEVQTLTRRNDDLQHVLAAYRHEQKARLEAEQLVQVANARSAGLEASMANMRRENEILRALCEERMEEAGILRGELLHTRSALVSATVPLRRWQSTSAGALAASYNERYLPAPYTSTSYTARAWTGLPRASFDAAFLSRE